MHEFTRERDPWYYRLFINLPFKLNPIDKDEDEKQRASIKVANVPTTNHPCTDLPQLFTSRSSHCSRLTAEMNFTAACSHCSRSFWHCGCFKHLSTMSVISELPSPHYTRTVPSSGRTVASLHIIWSLWPNLDWNCCVRLKNPTKIRWSHV